jgi:hypothetical protein
MIFLLLPRQIPFTQNYRIYLNGAYDPNYFRRSSRFTTWPVFPILTSTPLFSLIRNYQELPSQPLICLSMIITKCLEGNLSISLENDTLFFCEQGEMCALTLTNPHSFIRQLEKHVQAYPNFPEDPIQQKSVQSAQSQFPQQQGKSEGCLVQ